jgi:iron complex outermembrane receptor protein
MRFAFALASVVCLVGLSAQGLAQDAGGAAAPPAAPTPAPPAATELPPVDVIQKKATPAPKAAQNKSAPKKKQVAAPAPQPAPVEPVQPVEAQAAGTGGFDSGTVQMSPIAGSEIPITKYPGAVGRASAADIQRSGSPSLPEVLQDTVPGVVIGDAQGNIYQRNLQYRGFEASPVNGVPQGLAVYQNGVRINESFGDIVNWDFLPDNAIDGLSILGANPVYGLNALGGAVGIVMRDGFNFQGVELDSRFGSYGHGQGSVAVGARSGAWGAFIAGEYIQDGGFRDFSEAEIKRMYADIGVKRDGVELHLNYTGADNRVGVTAAAPEQLLDLGWNRTFTSPQTTDNELSMLSMNGSVKATSTLTFSGVAYRRWFKQKHDDGNIAEATECDGAAAGTLCWEDEDPDNQVIDKNGHTVPVVGGEVYGHDVDSLGSIDRTSQDAKSFGGAVQAVEKTPLFGMPNQFLIGTSYDHGNVAYSANSELGFFGPKFVVNSFDPPIYMQGPDDVRPRSLSTTNDYVGVYVSNTTDLTKQLSLTLGGRWNYARIDIQNENIDPSGDDPLTGTHEYYRFNPTAGATYALLPGLTVYGGYSEANRAPTAAELACADPEEPCLIESFLTADPPLKQVVSRTFELGLRGNLASLGADQKLQWTAGLFRTENQDDIIAVASPQNGRGYFLNAGDTLRQGFEAGVTYQDKRWFAYANYAFIDATFESHNILSSPDNPGPTAFDCPIIPPDPTAEPSLCIEVNPGDRLPGVPRHRFKAGLDYWVTRDWKVGGDLVAASDQVFFGDESNDNAPLAGYAKVDIRTSYNITENVQIYGLVDNIFDARYGLFGTFFNREAADNAGAADGLPANYFEDGNGRSITPAAPVTAYGGVKVRY